MTRRRLLTDNEKVGNRYPHALPLATARRSWNPERDARPWIRFCLTAHFRQAGTLLRRTRELERLWELLSHEVARRDLPERMLLALADAASGHRVRNSTYRSAAEVSDHVAGRDLKVLVDQGLLVSLGEKRGRFYVGSPLLRDLRERVRERKREEDPFAAFLDR